MEITATELKANLGKYLEEAQAGEIVITKNGKVIARLLGEEAYRAPAAADGYVRESAAGFYDAGAEFEWVILRGGVPWAKVVPFKPRGKRQIGFVKGPPVSQATDAAVFEPMNEEEWAAWETDWTGK